MISLTPLLECVLDNTQVPHIFFSYCIFGSTEQIGGTGQMPTLLLGMGCVQYNVSYDNSWITHRAFINFIKLKKFSN